jgi:hypothetical protein
MTLDGKFGYWVWGRGEKGGWGEVHYGWGEGAEGERNLEDDLKKVKSTGKEGGGKLMEYWPKARRTSCSAS